MGFYICLFLAPVEHAAAIRSIATTKERHKEDWPHLVVPGVDGPDMNVLEKLARPKRPKGSSRLGGEMLDKSKLTASPFTAVSRLTPEFVEALQVLDAKGIEELGQAWSAAIDGVNAAKAVQLVRSIVEFTHQGARLNLPILELVVM